MQAKELSKLLSVSQFIIELLRFQVCKPVVFFYCIRRLWKYRTLESIQVLVLFIEKLGPLYLSMKEIASLMNSELNHILSVCKSKLVDLNASEFALIGDLPLYNSSLKFSSNGTINARFNAMIIKNDTTTIVVRG